MPTGASAASASSPSWSSDRFNSAPEHSIPCDSTPRSLAFLILMPPGSLAPGCANGALRPAAALGAPHTICTVSLPVLTLHTRSLSASGWGSAATISATTTPLSPSARGVTASTSRPAIVSVCASASASSSGFTHSRSQFSERITRPPHRNCARKRRSFSKLSRRSPMP